MSKQFSLFFLITYAIKCLPWRLSNQKISFRHKQILADVESRLYDYSYEINANAINYRWFFIRLLLRHDLCQAKSIFSVTRFEININFLVIKNRYLKPNLEVWNKSYRIYLPLKILKDFAFFWTSFGRISCLYVLFENISTKKYFWNLPEIRRLSKNKHTFGTFQFSMMILRNLAEIVCWQRLFVHLSPDKSLKSPWGDALYVTQWRSHLQFNKFHSTGHGTDQIKPVTSFSARSRTNNICQYKKRLFVRYRVKPKYEDIANQIFRLSDVLCRALGHHRSSLHSGSHEDHELNQSPAWNINEICTNFSKYQGW